MARAEFERDGGGPPEVRPRVSVYAGPFGDIGSRARTVLRALKIETLQQLRDTPPEQLALQWNCGPRTFAELMRVREHGRAVPAKAKAAA